MAKFHFQQFPLFILILVTGYAQLRFLSLGSTRFKTPLFTAYGRSVKNPLKYAKTQNGTKQGGWGLGFRISGRQALCVKRGAFLLRSHNFRVFPSRFHPSIKAERGRTSR